MTAQTDAALPLSSAQEADDPALVRVFSAYMVSATLWLLFATAVGVLLSLKFTYPELGTAPALSFGRLRPIHTNDAFYAWASPALIGLADGEHRLRIEARDRSGRVGIHLVPFQVKNGPGITLTGLRPNSVIRDTVSFTVNAFGAEEPFEARRAESRSPIPVWVWVLSLVIVAWSAWYVATLWAPPPEFLETPTYAGQMTQHN
jgi:hypothetical protein